MKRILAVFVFVMTLAAAAVAVHADNKTTAPAAMGQTTTSLVAAASSTTSTAVAATTTSATAPAVTPAVSTALPEDNGVPQRMLGKADAPILMEEYVSFTCPHCADFYNNIFPQIKEHYVDTGKVRVVLHDFPTDAAGLKAGALARCMPEEQFYAFVSLLYKNQMNWAAAANPDAVLIQYAKLGGLPEEKAKSCLTDNKMQDALVASREAAIKNYGIDATPEFVLNKGEEKVQGVKSANELAAVFDKLLAAKK